MARLGSFSAMPLQSPFRLSCRRARSSPSFARRPRYPLPPPPRPNTREDVDDIGWLKEGRHFSKHKNGLRKQTNTMAIHQAGQITETSSPGCLKIPIITNDAEPIESLVPRRTSKPMPSNDYNRYANLRELPSCLDEQAERPNEKKDAFKPEEHVENNNRSAGEQGLEMLKETQSTDDIVLACSIEEVLIVNDVAVAKKVVRKLRGQYRDLIHACDTEVADIDVRKQSPVGHGRVTCFSIYCGPSADFGGGKTCVWVDSLDGGDGMFDIFKQYFEDKGIKKVWHNYSFDKHVLGNHEIKVAGFYADTVHLARLWNSGRKEFGYSLESLTSDLHVMDSVQFGGKTNVLKKTSMKELFAVKKINKNGSEGKIRIIPPVIELQRNENTRNRWVCYSAGDSVCTWMLWCSLKTKLEKQDCFMNGTRNGSMHDFYLNYWRPFGNVLVDMETKGILVDREYLAALEITAIKEQESATKLFRQWASKYCPDAQFMNVGSDLQVRQLLFGGFKSLRSNAELPKERVFQTPNLDGYIEEGSKRAKKTRPRVIRCVDVQIPVDHLTSSGFPQVTMLALKTMAGNVSLDLAAQDNDDIVGKQNPRKSNREDTTVYGTAYDAFGGGTKGIEACNALAALCEVSAINTLISGFIQPLQGGDILGPYRRIHCSMNLNTETGRLSARRPNLQNQPALEKDRYQIRKAFVASLGNSLIVADYGQLELRVLAHLSNCKSMIQAFKMGGDFHSRTAMNMYDYVRKAVGSGDVILEWKQKAGEEKPSAPMLKDKYAAERRKAKMLNFSIAYGKTPMGLAKDWKVTVEEAKKTVELWYNDRSEVREWQEQRKYEALRNRCVYTLMGRPRHFPSIKGTKISRGHIERVAINSPVQGSAADVAMCAMLEISRNARLRELGWELILQVHDEVILEGPSESAIEAKDLVMQCMCFPFNGRNILNVDLVVDAKCAQNWYEAK